MHSLIFIFGCLLLLPIAQLPQLEPLGQYQTEIVGHPCLAVDHGDSIKSFPMTVM